MAFREGSRRRSEVRTLLRRWGLARNMCREQAQRLREFKELTEQAKEIPALCEGAVDYFQRRCAAEFAFGRRMTEFIAALPPRLQTILWMRYSGNCSYLRIALRMNLSADHVKRLERDAVDRLLAMPGFAELLGGARG